MESTTSTGANDRATCRGRSRAAFHPKLSISLKEADESHWLEIIESIRINCDPIELARLLKEAEEIAKILTDLLFLKHLLA